MPVDISEIIKNFGGKQKINHETYLENSEFLGEEFVFEKPLAVDAEIVNDTKSLHLTGTVKGEMCVHCARCLKAFKVPVEFKISEILVRDDAEISEDDEVIVYSGHEFDLDEIVANNFLMNVESRYLCSEDCKGLCPECGQNLNEDDCDCEKQAVDPRWSALADIMKNTTDT